MWTVDDAVWVSRPLRTHNTFFIHIIRTLTPGSSLSRRFPQQLSHEEVLYFSEIYQRQQEEQKFLHKQTNKQDGSGLVVI